MRSEHVAVIARMNDDRVFGDARFFNGCQNGADCLVDQRNQPEVPLFDASIFFGCFAEKELCRQTFPVQGCLRLLPLMRGEAMPPENVFIEWAPNRTKIKKRTSLASRREIKRAVDESTRTVISPDSWKLCLRDKDLNELYNLNDDPWETRNLYEDRQYPSVISRLRGEIHRWQEATNDKLGF